jgi:hypothetical protein
MEVTHTNDGRIRNQGRQTDCELQVFFHGTFFRLIHSMVAETVGTVTQLIKEPRISQIWWPRPSSGRGAVGWSGATSAVGQELPT